MKDSRFFSFLCFPTRFEAAKRRARGFTLLELSISLIIIGLVAGGILLGRDMIRNAQIRSVARSVDEVEAAIFAFRSKYNAFPGDMPNATVFWARADNGLYSATNCAQPETDWRSTNAQATCNGNGDGQITNNTESFRVWQHLSNAGLIKGQYTGNGGTVGSSGWRRATIGTNVPAAGSSDIGMFITYDQTSSYCAPSSYVGTDVQKMSHRITLGAYVSDGPPWAAFITPEEAFSIDTKVDDGLPALGSIVTYCYAVCATSSSETAARYDTTQTGRNCKMLRKF